MVFLEAILFRVQIYLRDPRVQEFLSEFLSNLGFKFLFLPCFSSLDFILRARGFSSFKSDCSLFYLKTVKTSLLKAQQNLCLFSNDFFS